MESQTNQFVKLGKYGTVGVMLAHILAMIFFGWMIYSLATIHMARSNDVMTKLTSVVTELSTTIKLSNRLSLK